MENIIAYYIIIGISFIITSYIVTYRPAMKRTAGIIIELLNKNGASNEFLLEKAEKFMSWQYRYMTLVIYLVSIFVVYPIIAIATLIKNDSLIDGFSDGIINGLLEINE